MEKPFKPAGLNASYIRGLSPRVKWSTVEPAEGRYDWSYLDEVFKTASVHDKKIILRVHPGIFTPDWVYQAGAQRIQRSGLASEEEGSKQTISMPIPWDPVYLAKWKRFVKVLGERYNPDPSLYAVAVAGPTVTSVEFHLRGQEEDWEGIGYTSTKLLNTWKECIDAFARAFPNKAIALNIAFNILGNRELPQQIIDYALTTYKDRVFIQGNWLSANTSPKRLSIMRQFSTQTTVGFQMLGTSKRVGDLRTAIDNGLAGGASYLEIYQSDVTKLRFKEDIQYAATQLQIPPDQRRALFLLP